MAFEKVEYSFPDEQEDIKKPEIESSSAIEIDLNKGKDKKEEAKADKRHNSKSNNFRFSGKESHNKELINAFKSATDTLCIRSAFISKFVVNEKFEQLLIETLSRVRFS